MAWLWYLWLLAFGAFEAWAIIRKRRGDPNARTLTDVVQSWRDVRFGSLDVGRFLLACGLLWLVGHFFGAW
jgi:hypothetical protein